MEFDERVSRVQDAPLTSVREGDEEDLDERVVDAYLAARAIAGQASDSEYE